METIGLFVVGAMAGAVLFCVAVILTALVYERRKDEKKREWKKLDSFEDTSVAEQHTQRKRSKKGKGIHRVR